MNSTCPVCANPVISKSKGAHHCEQCNSALSYNSLPVIYVLSLLVLVAVAVLLPILLPKQQPAWLYPCVGFAFLLDTLFFLKSWNLYKAKPI